MRAVSVLGGSMPAQVDVDEARRTYMETQMRASEANPYAITHCALDMLLQRYEAGHRYLVFLQKAELGGWDTLLRFRIAGGNVINGDGTNSGGPQIGLTEGILDRFFPSLPAEGPNEHVLGEERPIWFITAANVPLQPLQDAISVLISEAATPEHGSAVPTLTLAPGVTIAPPSVGDGGLR